MDPGHKARKNPSDNADLGFQDVGPALRIMQLNVEGLSAAKYCTLVWSHSAHTSQVDVQLNSTMRLISGTLRSTRSKPERVWGVIT